MCASVELGLGGLGTCVFLCDLSCPCIFVVALDRPVWGHGRLVRDIMRCWHALIVFVMHLCFHRTSRHEKMNIWVILGSWEPAPPRGFRLAYTRRIYWPINIESQSAALKALGRMRRINIHAPSFGELVDLLCLTLRPWLRHVCLGHAFSNGLGMGRVVNITFLIPSIFIVSAHTLRRTQGHAK